ncbi:MAG TPA: sugar MFS transporter [Blastocatellia bacterium]|nr:sugar MFS transporter [Blastocatellia bacterium]
MAQKNLGRYVISISIIGALYFIFGFVTWLNGTLIPFLKLACDLHSDALALLVTFAFYMAYFFLALPSSVILGKTGYKKGMSLGLLIMAFGSAVFIPASMGRNFWVFLTGLFIQGMGLSLLQTAANPYITVIGPMDSAARRISIMGICNKVAGAVSPLILSSILLKGASQAESKIQAAVDPATRAVLLQELSQRIIMPYVVLAVVLGLAALVIRLSPLPEMESEGEDPAEFRAAAAKKSIFEFPHLLLGVLCIFVYVGAEVMAGDVIGTYGKALGLSLDITKNFTSYTLWSMVVGYVIGIATIPRFLKQENALKICALVAILFVTLALATQTYSIHLFETLHGYWGVIPALDPRYVSVMFIALLGLANSLMWPAIFPMAIDGLGPFTKIGSALLIMGIAGGAILPQVYARLSAAASPEMAFFCSMLPCYLYILFYAVKGHRVGRHTPQEQRPPLTEPASAH